MLNGEHVYHLRGPGGARDELEIEYWLGVGMGLPRRAIARTGERPGWSDEVYTIRIAATLRLLGVEEPVVLRPHRERGLDSVCTGHGKP